MLSLEKLFCSVDDFCQVFEPQGLSYHPFVEGIPSPLIPPCAYLRSCFGTCTGISFMDSPSVKIGHNRRISQHQVFNGLAASGKTSGDWFFGLKFHLVINDKGELLNFQVTPGNVDARSLSSQLFCQHFWWVDY